ncbi:MAG: amino acid adenylation domain-containing protein, partial [Bacteroidota bacterium]|nr:amino acid adenylation domain-containing protein [Bacteroidota bacterium]
QVVKKSIEALPLEIIDLSENGENYDDILNEIKKSEVERGFDYLKAPLFRIKLIKLEEEKYQFIWTYHHILLDGWSVPLLLQEIFAAYESLLDKRQLPASQRSSYGEYISWLKHQDILSAEKFWRDYLSGVEEPTYLPAKKLSSGRSVKEGEIETLEMELSKELTNKLQSLLSPQSITMNSLIQCIWATILNKYSLNDDVIFGSTVSGRPSDLWGSESMLGLFINTLPVRIKFDKDLNVIDWLKSVQKDQLLMRQFEYSPLTEIQNWTDIPRTKQLFETILVYENFPVKEFLGKEKGSFQIQKVQSSEKTNYPITLVAGQSDKLMLRILYDSSLFDSSAVKRIFSQMKRLLEEVANYPEKKLSELPYLPDEELNKVLKEWNDTTRSLPEFMTIHQMFEYQVKKTPDAQALYFNGESLSYRQLNSRANKLANYLRQIGAKKEELVGLYIDRSSEMIIGMLAILKAGCAYLPLDPKLPVDRLQFMADESSLKIILTKKTIIESKPLNNSAFICFDTDSDLIESQPDENLSIVVHPENLAYVIYTSGTTGRPKGVMVQHKGIINLALHYAEALSLGEGKKLFQFFSFSFDGSIVEIFCSLISGTTLYMPDAETAMPGPKMVKYLNENKIDKVTFSPSVLSVLPGEELNHIDAIIAGGEALSFDVVRKWFNRENLTFINAYGPTESTVCVSCFSMTSLPDFSDIIPIGRPLPNFRLYILDKDSNPAAIGVPGEIFVGGIGLARGYLNRPDITAERFIPDPFLEGQRLYRTGDVARYREDGYIEFLGRNDDQVKLRGFRIELGEIESAALNSDALQSAAALIISEDENAEGTLAFTDKINLANKDRDKQLVLFYVPNKKSQDITSAQIKDFIKKRLPEYMIPSKFVQLDMLPLNNSGKIDKKALISNLKQKDENSHEKRISLPQTLSEQLLLSLWKDLLKKETISTNDNFFELGGHSLIVTQLASRIIDAFGVEIALNRLFELTTIKQQASEIDLQKSESKLKETLIIKPVERTGELPLSFAQQRLWFLDQYEPESALYNLPAILRIKGSLKIDALINSINKLVKRHEILRTVFINDNGKARQLILPECDIKLDIEVRKVEGQSEEKIKEIFNNQMQKPFDLTKAPLFSIKLLEINPDDFVFILIMHHIISDGWSMGLMIREITELYNVEANSNGADVKEIVEADIHQLNIQYADYAFWQRQWLSGELLEEHKNYWNEQLLGAPEIINLPFDHPRPSVQTYNGSSFSFTIEEKLAETLRKISVKENSTLFMTLLSAFNILLYRYSGQTDIVVGTPVANRNSSEVEKLIGFFVNTIALRSRIDPNMTFNEVLYQLRKTTVDAYQYQNLPFEMLVDLLKPSRDLSYSPIFQVMFVFQNLPPQKKTLSDLSFYSMDFENTVAKFDLTLSISESENELLCGFEYNCDLFEKSTIEKMASHFINLIEELSLDTEKKLYEYDILENDEKDQLAWFSGANNKVPLENPFVIKSFEEHVRTNPDSIAVKYEDQAISYGELNRRSNMLARYLSDNGVKPEVIVALMAKRSIETIVSILAILKAGGAYLPVDPLYPEGRINYILEDSKASIIITQKDLDHKLQQSNLKVIYLDNIWENVEDYPPYSLQNRVEKENLAYVIYTSGSTGNPKGVMLNHLGLANLVQAQNKIFDISSSSRLLQFASLSFDASVSEIFTSLTSGAQLLLAPKEKLTASDELIELLEEEKVSVVTLPPSLLSNLPRRRFPYLKTIISAGERCPEEISHIFSEECRFINAYGPTEATVGSSFYLVEKSDETLGSVPIGKPIENGLLYILDEYLSPMPIGLTGELYIGGIGLARGYLNKAHLTAERFIPDPFDKSGKGERLYRTGDLARYLADGNIEFMGRVDNQVKLRGFRIELEEIENTLLQSSQIKESAVLIDEMSQNRNLIAFCTLRNASQTADIALIREEIRLKLPDYMVPSNYVFLEQMPLTSNGKIDRKLLLNMKYNIESLRREYVAPETDSEKTLIGLFSQLLNKDKIGIDDNFFDLGGDSILSIQLVALAAQAGIKLRPKDLFQFPTVRDLSTLCNQNIESSETIETETNTSDKESPSDDIPLTPIQHWFFEHHRLRPEHFNSSMYMELYIKLDNELLKKAVDIMISRHDSFRLSFINEDGQWKQRLLNAEIIEESKAMDGNLVRHPFRYYDLSSFSPREQKDILQEEIEKLESSFVLSEGFLFRVAYFELGKNANPRLLFIFHHLVMDGVSWRIIVDDFLRIYSKLRTGEVPVFHKKSSSYSDWAREIKRLADSETINKEYEYWNKLTNITPASLPIDFPEGISTYGSMDNITLSVPQQLTNRLLKELPLILKASVKDVLTTVLYRTISQWVKNSSIVIEMEGHGREDISDRLDLSQTVGWFTSSYPVLIKADLNEDIFKQVATVKDILRNIPANGFGFNVLKYLSEDNSVKETLKQMPKSQINFNYLGQFDQAVSNGDGIPFKIAGELTGLEQYPKERTTSLLYLICIVNGGELHIRWLYSRDVFKHSTIKKLAKTFYNDLRVMANHIISQNKNIAETEDAPFENENIIEGNSINK